MIISALVIETQSMTDTTATTVAAETVMIITTIVAISEATSEAALPGVAASEVAGGVGGMIENDLPHESMKETGIPHAVYAVVPVARVHSEVVDRLEDLAGETTGSVPRSDQLLHTRQIFLPTYLPACP